MTRSEQEGLLGYLDAIQGDMGFSRAALDELVARYEYSDCLRIVEAAVAEGATRYSDVFDVSKASRRLDSWRPAMRDAAERLAGWSR